MKIFLIVLAVLLGSIFVAFHVIKRKVVRALCRMGAVKISRELRGVFAGEHEFEKADRASFDDLDFSLYDSAKEVLESRGFRSLGGVEDVTVSTFQEDKRTLIELYAGAEGVAVAATYQVEDVQICDLFSETEEGLAYLTTNAELDKLTPPPSVDRHVLSTGSPVATLISAHEERLATLDDAGDSVRLRRADSFEEAIDSMRRFTKAVSEFRQSLGLLTQDELYSMIEEPGQTRAAEILWEEFQKVSDCHAEAA